ncbi:MAG: hypothetical protein KAX39_07230 [candidate division Zixibacteria bacterium]|nr:hypothetical protein [candidate division Zixibacteria bacterium]
MYEREKREMSEKDSLKDLDKIKPIDHGTIAKPHTPVYKMHRYFARRPYSVFRELIKHYSNPGNIILDPFCGGGVTVVEGLTLKRKVIGVDINPMATFITRMEVIDVDLDELQQAFAEIEAKVKDEIFELYMTKCPKCEKNTPADWFEWSTVIQCENCGEDIIIAKTKKTSPGRYQCAECKKAIIPSRSKRKGLVLCLVGGRCHYCMNEFCQEPSGDELKMLDVFDNMVREKKVDYPTDRLPPSNLERESALFAKGITHYYRMFTPRNLIACSTLNGSIEQGKYSREIYELLKLTFSSTLNWATKMSYRKRGKPVGWGRHDFWPPEVFCEINIWNSFKNRFKATLAGKKESQRTIGKVKIETTLLPEDLEENAETNAWVLTQSSHNLPISDEAIDVIVTDPPYGGNVNYAELCNFYVIWNKDLFGLTNLIDNQKEAIFDRNPDFEGAKTIKEYRNLMVEIFQECRRVLKPNGWMVMTFHSREFRVWNAIHLAAHDAGFSLAEEDGMIYQASIKAFDTAVYLKRSGSMLGDFVVSFQKAERLPHKKIIPYVEVEKKIQELAAESILHHGGKEGGASISTIHMKLIPFLLNNDLLEKIQEKNLPSYLRESFTEKDGKWYFKENLGNRLRDYLADYSKSHYKEDFRVLDFVPVEARLEYLIRRLLYKHGYATQDEILNEIYTNLINSNAAEYGEISRVLNRIAQLVPGPKNKREVWKLKEDVAREKQLDLIEEKIGEIVKVNEESEHDLMIRRLVELGAREELASHIGRTEQKKYREFRNLSIPMANNVQYGISQEGFRHITEIDVLWLKGDAIVSAFEVEKTTTIDSGINRFRNLFACQPNVTIEAYLVVPDKRKSKVERKLKSPANIKDSLTKKIGYILFSDLDVRKDVSKIDLNKIKKWVEV